jgi:hypothetical protein
MKLFRNVSFCLSFVILVTCIGLYFEYKGFDLGYEIGKQQSITQSNTNSDNVLKLAAHGPRTYEVFASKITIIILFVTIFLIGESFNFKIISRIICISSLSLFLYQFWWIFAEKELRSQTAFWNSPYDALLKNSLPIEWACFVLGIILLLIQMITIAFSYFDKRITKT